MCGKEANEDNARILLHFAIIQANTVGAPRGKALVRNQANLPSGSAFTCSSADTPEVPTPDMNNNPGGVADPVAKGKEKSI